MKKNLVYARTCAYNISYHVVWCVKYRRPVLSREIEAFMQEESVRIAAENGFTVHLLEVGDGDHVHCFVSAPPKVSVSYIVKVLKGVLARRLFLHYPGIRNTLRRGVLWNHSYYVETVGSVSEDAIRKYIERQTNSY